MKPREIGPYQIFMPEPRLAGFSLRELFKLRQTMQELDITLDQTIALAREGFNDTYRGWREQQAWRDHFGVLTELW